MIEHPIESPDDLLTDADREREAIDEGLYSDLHVQMIDAIERHDSGTATEDDRALLCSIGAALALRYIEEAPSSLDDAINDWMDAEVARRADGLPTRDEVGE